ncbi:divalent cation transporter [Tamilnaduibacter salinus]|uniref:Divalent cation transporter n=1 Tax=Tamilnaduibacter salinus TaxID=1484056 RepID=A0A2A2I652_9GAMM|nr:divalent cation transporter [Tamilnaduibacter salinus]PAV27137.1 divalent cation transporter [Tamilnaduibacter salinus]
MDSVWPVVLMATLAGAAIPAGAFLGRLQPLFQRWLDTEFRHSVIAFGGGALLAAVSLVLVPKGMESLSVGWIVVGMLGGGIAFGMLDAVLSRLKGSVSQLVAMLADFIPEALALGALFAANGNGAYVLALLIGLQNLPEGFNAFRELTASDEPAREHRGRTAQDMADRPVLLWFLLLVPLGPLAGLAGHFWLVDQAATLGFIMMFASGGILYLVFQDIAPQARLERHWAPSLGAVAGFLLGVLGHLAVG